MTASSTEQIVQNVEKFKGCGVPRWARLKSNTGKEIFTIWNDPFSGRAATFVQAYYFDGNQWILFLDELIEDTSVLSPRISADNSLVYDAGKRQKVLERSLDHLKPLGR